MIYYVITDSPSAKLWYFLPDWAGLLVQAVYSHSHRTRYRYRACIRTWGNLFKPVPTEYILVPDPGKLWNGPALYLNDLSVRCIPPHWVDSFLVPDLVVEPDACCLLIPCLPIVYQVLACVTWGCSQMMLAPVLLSMDCRGRRLAWPSPLQRPLAPVEMRNWYKRSSV